MSRREWFLPPAVREIRHHQRESELPARDLPERQRDGDDAKDAEQNPSDAMPRPDNV